MSHEALQHLRIRCLPKWLTSWSIFLLDASHPLLLISFLIQKYRYLYIILFLTLFYLSFSTHHEVQSLALTASRFIEIQRVVLTTFTIVVLMIFLMLLIILIGQSIRKPQ